MSLLPELVHSKYEKLKLSAALNAQEILAFTTIGESALVKKTLLYLPAS